MGAYDGRFNWVLDGEVCLANGWSSGIRYNISSRVANSCPANSTQSGNQCICAAGYVDTGTSCKEKDNDPCELLIEACAGSEKNTTNFEVPGKKAGISFVCVPPTNFGGWAQPAGCTKGCMATVGGFTTAFQSDSGDWVTQGKAKYSGASCEPSVINDLNSDSDPEFEPDENPKVADKPDTSCPNGFKGEVNGVIVCVPPKASSGTTEMEEKDNGDGTKTKSKTEVKCESGKCDITKSSTTVNNTTNNTVSSSSVTTTVDKKAFCSQNKTADVCKNEQGENEDGDGKFSGSCKAGFECKGDAVMCAMAKEQHKRACDTLEPVTDPASFIKQVEAGTDPKSAEKLKEDAWELKINTELDTSGRGLPRSCPADPRIDLPFVSKTLVIPFSLACPTLKIMSDVALMITALSLLVWLVSGKKEE